MRLGVCLKWVDLRPEPDGTLVRTDARTSGASPADHAALELALRAADTAAGDVVAVTAGPPETEAVLREALAAGAAIARRVPVPPGVASDAVARSLAVALADCDVIWCGDHSLDRGSGSVPAFLAAELGVAQALGLVEVHVDPHGALTGLRRLDGGRRERLRIDGGRAVVSVEGSVARLRRATLTAAMAAGRATIDVVRVPAPPDVVAAPITRPYRPRPRALAPPQGATALARVAALTSTIGGDAGSAGHGEVVTLPAPDAARRILDTLAAWGYDRPT